MKAILRSLTCLMLLAACSQVHREYVVMVPPWRKLSAPKTTTPHEYARMLINDWALKSPLFKGVKFPFVVGHNKEVNIPRGGGNAFTARLTERQAKQLAQDLKLFVSLSQKYEPDRIKILPYSEPSTKAVSAANRWAADVVVNTGTTFPAPLLNVGTQRRTPVLYVVDTGVQPFIGNAVHPQFTSIMTTLHFRQGSTPHLTWPLSSTTSPSDAQTNPLTVAPWNNPVDQPMNLTSSSTPWPVSPPPTGVANPFTDPITAGHGTMITSAAVSASVGALSKMTTSTSTPLQIDVQPIRIYGSSGEAITPDTLSGIYEAVRAHLARGPGAASVLLFASRTTCGGSSSFDQNVEVALLYAWSKGMIVVVSGGNETAAWNSGSPAKKVPYAIWYPLPTSKQPSTPSRFDWTQTTPADPNWPGDTGDGTYQAPPTERYLVIVGANNASFSAAASDANNITNMAKSGWYANASVGPDVDITAPGLGVPVASTSSSNNITWTGAPTPSYVVNASGSSLATGYVAGVALAYLATTTTSPSSDSTTPKAFLDWLVPATQSSTKPAKVGTAAAYPTPNANGVRRSPYRDNASYNFCVPKLQVTQWP